MKGETRTTTANTVLPKAGLNSFDWTFVQGSTVVILLNFCASISPPSAIPKTLGGNPMTIDQADEHKSDI